MSRRPPTTLYAGLLLLLLLAAALRISGLGQSSLWLDEINSYNRAIQPTWSEVYPILRAKNHAPLYDAVVLHHWLRLGTDAFLLRLPSAYFGLLTVAATYALARALFTPFVGWVSALLLALSPIHIYYSREARMYALVTLLVALSLYFLARAMRNKAGNSWPAWVGYTVCAALALYTHYYAGFALIALAVLVVVWTGWRRAWRQLAAFLLAEVGVALLFAPWLPTFWAQLRGNPVAWLPEPSGEFLFDILARFFLDEVVLGWAFAPLIVILLVALAGGVGLFLRQRGASFGWGLVMAASAGTVGVALVASLFKPLLFDRYLLVAVPPACIVVGGALAALWQRGLFRLLVPVVLAGILASAYGVATIDWKPDWRGLAAQLRADAGAEDEIVIVPGNFVTSLHHYYSGAQEKVYISGGATDLAAAFAPLAGEERFWLVSVMPEVDALSRQTRAYAEEQFHAVQCRDYGEQALRAQLCLYQTDR